ncbi:leucine-rich repeat-containing protein 18 [Oreochromis aureus]|uniref:Disease resistance R13L4/SHOC-2-like LRR domain-containing protein n=1 Tax=Oreochromis aureus TaxID=47969 RepID=A0A668T3W7_OREAU|nr:leucine-rich repeat-containing protein 18 [Oreochromis aureus]XP_039477569.1 leucine-rich repeat-containing protein 18 [Oreochromis aureus]XP_039477570.1 leucine-rich repeat-containing protein 18 [Oreochromis aureus]XP_039477571.1 leucine-rich repeat-containing protein 18 [Oreochromis aureus]XP_039477572.1 leucine-rich repeat-containing protein 18 [Oreochromis aureus]
MPKRKEAKGTKVTLKTAKKAIRMTPDGRRRLVLSNMGITIFPKCLFKLTFVDELDLSRNLIEKLPENFGNLLSLRWLDLHSNKLVSVPESIGDLRGLTSLNLSNNCLTFSGLPSTLGSLTNLKSLNLGMNQLDDLPPTLVALENLQELGLFDNLFKKLPQFLQGLSNLTKVNVKRNPLSYHQRKGETLKEKSEHKEDVYLVHESSLCRTCLKRCQAEREKLMKGGGEGRRGRRREAEGGGVDCGVSEKKKKRAFPGLVAPNSVATVNQDLWRLREKLECVQVK